MIAAQAYDLHAFNSSGFSVFRVCPYCLETFVARPFQGIRSEDRTIEKGFAPTAEIFYGTRIKVKVAAAIVSLV